ncbi:pyridoxamine 5'-phosphate oxidase family protein [Streptomyces sp. S.PNR 29]|uniref:pyridoxamine 5'-phosphate oxidase family protein n=1 Tax=Streptomyces sp. S.PNR 29 TaxID=2973805 RepID=UPI0025AFFF61|nr:pyridoxamine 5'-phosphate oxidase family protein [Streptomyces sp. S.PNR 29]MDN0194056.1 pyridoxamine 5'-phosphate oxidase family protein [Streptomyces sp. S.PNR 29]
MALTREEREQFLVEPHIAALAVDAGPGRAPLTVPIWYQYEPGGDIWIMTGLDSRKNQLISAAGRFSLMVDRQEPTVRYVSVEGPVVETTPATVEQLREISARYLPAEAVEPYVEFSLKNHGENVVIRMRPERWVSADMGSVADYAPENAGSS